MCGFAIFAPECKNRKVTMNATTSFWTRAYRRHISRLIGVCYRYVPDRAVAEDLAHDAFLQAMEKADTLRSFENFGNWLTRIAVNIALHYLRDNHLLMRTDHSVDVEGVLDDDPVDDAEMSAEDMMAAIRKADFTQAEILDAISQIPENHRVVLNLFVFEHYSHQKIAELRGISVNTSKSHLLRARKRLQQILFSKSKQKKLPVMFIFPFFIRQESALDHYCRRQLSGFCIPPEHPLSPNTIANTASISPTVSVWHRSPVPFAAGAASVAAGAFLLTAVPRPEMPPAPSPAPAHSEVSVAVDSVADAAEEPVSAVEPPTASVPKRTTTLPKDHIEAAVDDELAAEALFPADSALSPTVVVKKTVRRQHTVIVKDTSNH